MESLLSLDQIKTEVERLGKKAGAPDHMLPTFGHTNDFARPHIEVNEIG